MQKKKNLPSDQRLEKEGKMRGKTKITKKATKRILPWAEGEVSSS